MVDTLVTGGAERLVVTFAKAARNRPDVHLTVFVLSAGGTPFCAELEQLGVEVVYLPGKSLIDPVRFFHAVWELKSRSIEYVHAHLISSTVVGGYAAALLGIPFATTIHNVKASTARVGKARGYLYRSVLRMTRTTRIAVGQAVAQAARADTGGRDCIVVPNAVAPDAIASPDVRETIRAEMGVARETVVIAVGAIIGQKAYDDLLTAFSSVAKHAPDAVLWIAGNAPEPDRFENLQEQSRASGLEEKVKFLGLRRDIPALLRAADIFVSSSHWEGLPVSVLEAMANGLPCVVTDVGDNARVLTETGCPVVPARQPGLLAEALVEMLGDAEARNRIGRAAQRRVQEQYGVDSWVERLMQIYGEGARK
ncbi:hypothetical protein AVO45_09445 [Ruegeria marisrubri]|uniref:Glycosyltransferase subfamily 4-like N-terminal domain-containing protein n=2 Tax=Ruegeria marisrubri TaxID=1685379 RepID=A0A0X3TQZ1_9RHOB|nr:hypothetical protein AVO45_09445 [Ruegeria marisrubri]